MALAIPSIDSKKMDNQKLELLPPEWFYQKIISIPEGASRATFENRLYIVTKNTFNGGQSFKFFASEAGGRDYVSLNVYKTSERIYIKPCEQPVSKSQNFLQNADFSSVSK